MYLEGIGDGRRFYDLARATTPRKPVIVLRGGLSALGRRAASSHTGALAGSAEVFRAAARQAGVILAVDPDEALDAAGLLAYLPLPAGAASPSSPSAAAGASDRRPARGATAGSSRSCHRR